MWLSVFKIFSLDFCSEKQRTYFRCKKLIFTLLKTEYTVFSDAISIRVLSLLLNICDALEVRFVRASVWLERMVRVMDSNLDARLSSIFPPDSWISSET